MGHTMSFQNGKARDLMEFQQQQLEELRQSLQRSEVASQRLKRGKQRLQQSMEGLTSRETYLTQKKERLLQELRKSSLSKDKNGAASSSDFSGISGVDPMEPRAGKFKTLGPWKTDRRNHSNPTKGTGRNETNSVMRDLEELSRKPSDFRQDTTTSKFSFSNFFSRKTF